MWQPVERIVGLHRRPGLGPCAQNRVRWRRRNPDLGGHIADLRGIAAIHRHYCARVAGIDDIDPADGAPAEPALRLAQHRRDGRERRLASCGRPAHGPRRYRAIHRHDILAISGGDRPRHAERGQSHQPREGDHQVEGQRHHAQRVMAVEP